MNRLLIPLLLASTLTSSNWFRTDYEDDFNIKNNVLVEVTNKTTNEIRIYKASGITVVADDAFKDCQFTTIMVSNSVKEINDEFPETLTTFLYTGSEQECDFTISDGIEVKYYACDEGFLNYWTTYIRPGINGSICNVAKADYVKMKELFASLTDFEKSYVLEVEDGTGKIKNSIKFLDEHFANSNRSQSKEKEISQSTMIALILIIASFGMTSIGIFYILKDRKVIK